MLLPAASVAQTAEIETRIANAFDLVEGNPVDLAVPLARLALARRSIEVEAAKAAAGGPEVAAAVAGAPQFSAVVVPAGGDTEIEQGSAEDLTDEEIARLPRPRPAAPGEEPVPTPPAVAQPLIGQPLDLVAGAASILADTPPILVASATPGATADAPAAAAAPAAPLPIPQRELVARGSCVAVDDVADRDGDFARNESALSDSRFCIAQTRFKERGKSWTVQTVASGRPGPLWAVLHDNEDLSFDNAVWGLMTYGGALIAVDTGGRRLLEGIDPNRNFSADGIGCEKVGDDATPQFTMLFRGLFDPAQPIVALHNNGEGRTSTGGHGHASMSTVPRDMIASPAPDQDGPLAGDDTLVLLAVTDREDAAAAARTEALNAAGINVVREIVRPGRGDCSFSNYALLSGHTDYVNITVDTGQSDEQKRIVEAVLGARPAAVATQ